MGDTFSPFLPSPERAGRRDCLTWLRFRVQRPQSSGYTLNPAESGVPNRRRIHGFPPAVNRLHTALCGARHGPRGRAPSSLRLSARRAAARRGHDAHAQTAIQYDAYTYDAGSPNRLAHAQLVHCQRGIVPNNKGFLLRNVLMKNVLTNFYNIGNATTG